MATSFSKILAEVQSKSNPQRQSILKQISSIPEQQKAQESSLVAMKDQAYDDILSGARQRGLGFSGIPLGEQAEYNATQFAPAVANLKSGFNERRSGLEQALAGIGQNNYMTARDIYDRDRQFEEQRRQFNEQLAAQRSATASSSSGADYLAALLGNTKQQAAGPSVKTNSPGSFTFLSAAGKPITAGQYAKATNNDIRDVLYEIGSQGDKSAAGYYNILRGIEDPTQLNNTIQQLARKAPHIFNGYVTSAPFAPVGGK